MSAAQHIGRYELVGHLASGGMGHVYLARSTGLGGFEREVVIKTLDLGSDEDDRLVAMFLDEARVLGALHHQFIAPIYEVGCDDGGRYFLVMEYVRGETAEQVIAAIKDAGGPPPLVFALSTIAAIAAALEYAHDACRADGAPLEIVHRDVTPSNIMIGREGGVKLIDFGIAKFAHRTSQTQIGSLKGKLGYLSPEQILHKPIDRRADIFAVGIVLYEMTTLTRAFEGASELLVLEKIIHGELVPPSRIVADYPPELERIVMKAVAADPGLRYQDAGALGRDLEAFAARHGIPLGHAAIRDVMTRLFSGPNTRRRFPRASSEVSTGRRPVLPEVDDVDITPIDAEPIALSPLEHADEPEPPEPFVEAQPASLVVRITTPPPVKVATVTAQLPRKTSLPDAPPKRWWMPLVLVGVAAAVAAAVAHL